MELLMKCWWRACSGSVSEVSSPPGLGCSAVLKVACSPFVAVIPEQDGGPPLVVKAGLVSGALVSSAAATSRRSELRPASEGTLFKYKRRHQWIHFPPAKNEAPPHQGCKEKRELLHFAPPSCALNDDGLLVLVQPGWAMTGQVCFAALTGESIFVM